MVTVFYEYRLCDIYEPDQTLLGVKLELSLRTSFPSVEIGSNGIMIGTTVFNKRDSGNWDMSLNTPLNLSNTNDIIQVIF